MAPENLFSPINERDLNPMLKSYQSQMTTVVPLVTPKGRKLKVMVVDTGIMPHFFLEKWVDFKKQSPIHFDQAPKWDTTFFGHGTHVTGIIAYGDMTAPRGIKDAICDEVEIVSCNIYRAEFWKHRKSYTPNNEALFDSLSCVNKAIEEKVDIINYSVNGDGFYPSEYDTWKKFTDTGGLAIVAAGNDGANIEENPRFPASFGIKTNLPLDPLINLYPVINLKRDGITITSGSDYYTHGIKDIGENVLSTLPDNSFGTMTGTSQSAPNFTHKIIKKYCSSLKPKTLLEVIK